MMQRRAAEQAIEFGSSVTQPPRRLLPLYTHCVFGAVRTAAIALKARQLLSQPGRSQTSRR